jgi:hypothetical protein
MNMPKDAGVTKSPAPGYVYILTSQNSPCVKIGRTDICPMKRIREINNTEPYKSLGPWTLGDFRQVSDCRTVEYDMHYAFRSKRNEVIREQKELFNITLADASDRLNQIDPALIVGKPKVDRMFQDEAFRTYLTTLFMFTGLSKFYDDQGGWTLTLFPNTAGGRYFTLNIGTHEVAFSSLPNVKRASVQVNMIYMNDAFMSNREAMDYIHEHNGYIDDNNYTTARPNSVSVLFPGSFDVMINFYSIKAIQHSIRSYWFDYLLDMHNSGKSSFFLRFHNYNAVAAIKKITDTVMRFNMTKVKLDQLSDDESSKQAVWLFDEFCWDVAGRFNNDNVSGILRIIDRAKGYPDKYLHSLLSYQIALWKYLKDESCPSLDVHGILHEDSSAHALVYLLRAVFNGIGYRCIQSWDNAVEELKKIRDQRSDAFDSTFSEASALIDVDMDANNPKLRMAIRLMYIFIGALSYCKIDSDKKAIMCEYIKEIQESGIDVPDDLPERLCST